MLKGKRVVVTLGDKLPVKRVGTSEDVAHSALYLMENEFTTGNVLFVDGGHRFV